MRYRQGDRSGPLPKKNAEKKKKTTIVNFSVLSPRLRPDLPPKEAFSGSSQPCRHGVVPMVMPAPIPTVQLADLTLEDLLPHRPGMLLLDTVVEVDATRAVTLSTVATTWPLAGPQGAPPLLCIELAAQTAGVCNGWDRVQTQGRASNQMGWLVAVKRAEFHVPLLPLGATIRAEAENTLVFANFRENSGHLFVDGQLAAEVILQLYQA